METNCLPHAIAVAPGSPASPSSKYECATCGKTFPNSTRYHKHVKLHEGFRSFRCSFLGCGKTFKRKPHFTRHLAQHQAEKPYKCNRVGCGRSFASKQKLAKHERSHEGLSCNVCGERFRQRSKLEEHQRAHDAASGSSSLICPQCNAEVADKSALQRHMKRHKWHACQHCEEKFLRFRDLVRHQRSQHPKTHLCPDCGKAYKREGALRDHQRRVHAEEVRVCPHPGCGQTFTSASNLHAHERTIHCGLRPFSCRDCDQTFAYKHVLRRHRRVIHRVRSSPSKSPEPKHRRTLEPDEALPPASEAGGRENVKRSAKSCKFIRWGCLADTCTDGCGGCLPPPPPPPPSVPPVVPAHVLSANPAKLVMKSSVTGRGAESMRQMFARGCGLELGVQCEDGEMRDRFGAMPGLPTLDCY